MKTPQELGEEWVHDTNGYKWANSKDEVKDNYDSFLAGYNAALIKGVKVVYQTLLKEGVRELLQAEKSILTYGYVKITIDEEYKCSDDDLAKYKIEYQYPLHLISLGEDLHKANLKLSDELKRKWFIK